MADRFADRVMVPHVVGLPFHIGRDIASVAGVSLVNPDPDGPPVGALAWPGLFYITSQRPGAGTFVYRWDSVVVEIVEHGTAEFGVFRGCIEPPPFETAHASAERLIHIDLTRYVDPPRL